MARMGLIVAGIGILASGAAAIVLLRAPHTPNAPGATELTPEILPSAGPPPSAAQAQTDVETLLAACPLVDRATAVRLRGNPTVAALGPDEFTLLVLSMGDQGLPTIGSDKVGEVRKSFALMFASMASDERSAFSETVAQMREGRQPTPSAARTALSALRAGAARLPAEHRDRLRDLYSAAIDSGIAHQQAAAERTRSAVVFATPAPPTYVPGRPASGASRAGSNASPVPVASAPRAYDPAPIERERRGDAYWRPLLAAAQERVKRAERELELVDRPLSPDPPVGSSGVPVSSITYIGPGGSRRTVVDMTGRGAIELRDEARKAEAAAQAQAGRSNAARAEARDRAIARARRELDQARAALSKLEDEARADLVAIR